MQDKRSPVTKVLLFSGKAKHGKTACGEIVKKKLEEKGKRVLIINYADYLKFIAKEYYGWDGNKDDNGRTLLQWLGTDKIRAKYPDFWVDTVINLIEIIKDDFDVICICDVRFPNEIMQMAVNKNFETISINVERENFDNGLTKEQQCHPSETSLRYWIFDWYISSESGLDKLEKEVDKMIKYYYL